MTRKKRKIPTSVYLAYLLVATLLLTGVTFSGYVTTVGNKDEARVALMATTATLRITGDIPLAPGESTTIPITLTNYESNSKICEVAQEYTISIERLEDNLPLECQLYSNENCTEQSNGEGEFPAGVKEEDYYWLKVTWPQNQNSEALAFEVDALRIIFNAEQID